MDVNVSHVQMFGLGVLTLISEGKSESLKDVISHCDKRNIADYFTSKYRGNVFFNERYSDAINQFYSDHFVFEDDAGRKYGLFNDTDGLLLLVSLIVDAIGTLG
jgi:hypothetical protein